MIHRQRYELVHERECIGKTTTSLEAVWRHRLFILDNYTQKYECDKTIIVSQIRNEMELINLRTYITKLTQTLNQDHKLYIIDVVDYCLGNECNAFINFI